MKTQTRRIQEYQLVSLEEQLWSHLQPFLDPHCVGYWDLDVCYPGHVYCERLDQDGGGKVGLGASFLVVSFLVLKDVEMALMASRSGGWTLLHDDDQMKLERKARVKSRDLI